MSAREGQQVTWGTTGKTGRLSHAARRPAARSHAARPALITYGSICELYASPRHGGGEAGAIIGAGGEADEVEPAQIVVQIAGGDAAAGPQEVLPAAVAAVHRLHMQVAPNPFPHRAVEALVAHSKRGGARRVAHATVGDQQGVLGDHRIEGGREHHRVNPGKHRAERRPAPVRCHENRHLLA